MERRRLDGGIDAVVSSRLEREGFLAAFTERRGGVSNPPFDSLNVGPETGDAPDLVAENLEQLRKAVGADSVLTVRQVHGARVHRADTSDPQMRVEADALITSRSDRALAVVVADCVPLVLASPREGAVACVHVGWRGLASGVVQAALDEFDETSTVIAAIGPSIGPCHYEVGPEVVRAVAEGVGDAPRVESAAGCPRLDLAATVEDLLEREGVEEVDRAQECTACEASRFFSHRRDGRTGRQAGVAIRL